MQELNFYHSVLTNVLCWENIREILRGVCRLWNLTKSLAELASDGTFPNKTRLWGMTSASFWPHGRSIYRLRVLDRISPSTTADVDVGLHKSGIIHKIRAPFLWRAIAPRMRGAPTTRGCPSICVPSRPVYWVYIWLFGCRLRPTTIYDEIGAAARNVHCYTVRGCW